MNDAVLVVFIQDPWNLVDALVYSADEKGKAQAEKTVQMAKDRDLYVRGPVVRTVL